MSGRKKTGRFWRPILLIVLVLGFSSGPRSEDSGLQKLFADYFEFQLREDPGDATSLGRNEYNDRWDDPSPEHLQQRRGGLQQFLDRLHSFRVADLAGQEGLSYRILEWDLKTRIDEIDTVRTYNAVNQFVGGQLKVFGTMSKAPANTVKDYEDQIARLRALPKWADETIAAANLSLAQKNIEPRLVVDLVVKQLDLQMAPAPLQSPLLKAFTKFPASIPESERQRLVGAATEAYTSSFLPAWHKLRDYVATTYAPAARDTIGLSAMPDGSEMYTFFVRRRTTTNYTPAQIHEIGLKEVDRIQSQMAEIRKELNFTGTPAEFSDQVLNASRFRFHSEEEILVHGRDIAKRIDPELPKLFKVLPRMTYGVAAIPAYRARTSAPYYEPPALDGSRAGYFYLRTVDPEKQSNCCMEALILHESVPGHHLQNALAQEIPGLPDFRKAIWFTAYGEGWGLYAETLGYALNMYETPYERYGQLQSELFRAARLVVDTGIHTQGWTREQAIDYLYNSGANPSRDFMESEVDRYIANPGQALAYKIGQLKILELRSEAEKELGPKYDIKTFHDVVLRNGALPLDILEEQVRDWIAQTR
jgi:uncharacterized protein (DUF885 family)